MSVHHFSTGLLLLTATLPTTTIAFINPIQQSIVVERQPFIASKQQHVAPQPPRQKTLELPYLIEEMEAPTTYISPTFFDKDDLARMFDRLRSSSKDSSGSSLASSIVEPAATLASVIDQPVEHIWDRVLTHGTKTHLYNALLGLTIPLLLFGSRMPFLWSYLSDHQALLSILIIEGSFLGLVIENMINASGKYLGEGMALRKLTRIRLALHGLTIPSCFIPVIELGKRAKLFSTRVSKIGMGICLSYAFAELIEWLFMYDINDLKVVDNSDVESYDHHPRYMKGTLVSLCCYSSASLRCNRVLLVDNMLYAHVLFSSPSYNASYLLFLVLGLHLWKGSQACCTRSNTATLVSPYFCLSSASMLMIQFISLLTFIL